MSAHSRSVWLAIRLPLLPLEVFGFDSDTDTAMILHKQRVVCATKPVLNEGVISGMPATTAQMLTNCQQVERDLTLEQTTIRRLADCLYAFTPHIQYCPPNPVQQSGLIVEISRSLKLFKGLDALVVQLREAIGHLGYTYALALANTDLCAWLLTWHPAAELRDHLSPDNLEQLQQLPIRLLAECHTTDLTYQALDHLITDLEKSGFTHISDLIRQIEQQNTASLRRRWGTEFCELLSRLLQIDHDLQQPPLFSAPLPQYHPQQFFYDSVQFDYPLKTIEQLLQPMTQQLQNLQSYLTRHQQQCQQIEWLLLDIYHNKQAFRIQSSQQQTAWPLFLELSRIQMEAHPLQFEVDTVELICRHTFACTPQSQPLAFLEADTEASEIAENFALVTAKLKARLGDTALFKVTYRDSHIPEISTQKSDLGQHKPPTCSPESARPGWLFDVPMPIQEKQQNLHWRGDLTLLQGPERIEGNWWQQQTARDYFIASRDDGLRLWIFYDLQRRQWFVHGIF